MGRGRAISEGRGRFQFAVEAVGAWANEQGELLFEGVASSTRVDRQHERMSAAAMEQMAQCQGLPLLSSHHRRQQALGTVTDCRVDAHLFRVQGKLNRDVAAARELYERLQNGEKLGLSVGGRVLHTTMVHDEESGQVVRQIDGVHLDHVAICSLEAAANPDTYLKVLAKAAAGLDDENKAAAEVEGAGDEGGGGEAGEAGVWAALGELWRQWWQRGKRGEDERGLEREVAKTGDAERTDERDEHSDTGKALAARLAELEQRLESLGRSLAARDGSLTAPAVSTADPESGLTAHDGGVTVPPVLAKGEGDETVNPGQPQHLRGQRVKDTQRHWEGVL